MNSSENTEVFSFLREIRRCKCDHKETRSAVEIQSEGSRILTYTKNITYSTKSGEV